MKLSTYYKSKWWIDKSREMRDKFPNCYCCSKPSQHTHHRHYNSIGAELDSDLITLCRKCHEAIERGVKHQQWTRLDGHKNWKVARGDSAFSEKLHDKPYKPGRKKIKGDERKKNIAPFESNLSKLASKIRRGRFAEAKETCRDILIKLDEVTTL